VELILTRCDRSKPAGRRDYAILLLLARLGLRAGEVAGLELGDIDWRSGEIRVLGKGLLRDRMPLVPEAGEALASYLRRDRPRSSSRRVFLSLKAPFCALRGSTVSHIVERAVSRSGLKPPFSGAHLLRHSLATNLLRKGVTLQEIAEVLRHRSTATTQIYAKVDIQALRSLAQPWPTMRVVR
jgi:site-specific recombinase XerD